VAVFGELSFFVILFSKKGNLQLNILFKKYISPNGKIGHQKKITATKLRN
jgi:hypothetical protein